MFLECGSNPFFVLCSWSVAVILFCIMFLECGSNPFFCIMFLECGRNPFFVLCSWSVAVILFCIMFLECGSNPFFVSGVWQESFFCIMFLECGRNPFFVLCSWSVAGICSLPFCFCWSKAKSTCLCFVTCVDTYIACYSRFPHLFRFPLFVLYTLYSLCQCFNEPHCNY